MICTVCGLFVFGELMSAHLQECRGEQARVSQIDATYYGNPIDLAGWDKANEPQMLAQPSTSANLTDQEKEVLSINCMGSRDFAKYYRKES